MLADLTEAYYLDDDEDGSGFDEDGIRHHHWRGPIGPLFAWYRGPFMALFQSDLREGVAVLNRMLNHAAKARARTLANLSSPWGHVPDDTLDDFKTELHITGTATVYIGDPQTWVWYRSGKLWHGDLDLTLDEPKLAALSQQIAEVVFVLYEYDGRFDHEQEPLLERAVFSVTPSGHTRYQHRYYRARDRRDAP